MAKIIMLKGLPASGKSTWAKQKVQGNGNFIRISKDDIRESIFGGWTQKREKYVLAMRDALIKEGIRLGKNVIVDDTNLNPIHEAHFREMAKELGVGLEINDSFLKVDIEECVERDLKRLNSVGQRVIYKMYYDYLAQDPLKKIDKSDKPRCVICDIDGTLAHNLSGRNIYDYTRVIEDTPDPLVCAVVDSLDFTFGDDYLDIIIVSGREDSCRQETEEWLEHNDIPFTALYMRQEGDRRDDVIVKEEIYKKYIEPNYCVLGVIDDRPKVARNWRQLGLKTMQVGVPEYEF